MKCHAEKFVELFLFFTHIRGSIVNKDDTSGSSIMRRQGMHSWS